MKKVLKFIFLSMLAVINVAIFIMSFSSVIGSINQIIVYGYYRLLISVFTSSFFAINSLLVIALCIYLFIKIIKPAVSNKAQYTYEEYKAKMDEKKALRKEAQKEKLKQKLNELEKGD